LPKRDGRDLARVLARKAAAAEIVLRKLLDDPDAPDEIADRDIELPADADRASALTPWATGFRYEDVPEQPLDRPMVRGVVDAVSRWAKDMGIREAACG
jgi:hypothetical protein